MLKDIFENIYKKPNAVWTRTEPPKELKEFVEGKQILLCKTIDVACGEGIYSIYLASKGFDVLGIDISEKAIEYAKQNASKQNVDARFKVLDIQKLSDLNDKFDFVFEWGLMHHLPREVLPEYIKNVSNLLNSNGKYLTMHFNLQGSDYGTTGQRFREVPDGTRIYYSTLEEMKELFEKHFKVVESKMIEVPGRSGPNHTANYFILEKL